MITKTNPEINISFLVASREEIEMDRKKVGLSRKEAAYISVTIHFTFSQTFKFLSYQLKDFPLLFQAKFNVHPILAFLFYELQSD